jgi:hypothetical protein
VLALVVLALAGCGPSSYAEFRSLLDARWCQRQVRCGDVGANETQKCDLPAVLAVVETGAVDPLYAIDKKRMLFHPDNARECLSAVDKAPCNHDQAAIAFNDHCHGVVTAAVAVGDSCRGDEECVGGACSGAACGGHCVAYANTGAPCVPAGATPAMTCDPTVHYCDGGVCRKKKSSGQGCVRDLECTFDLFCNATKCGDLPRGKTGDACGGGLPVCADGLYCDGTCKECTGTVCTPGCATGSCATTAKLGPGIACHADADCHDGLFCQLGYCAHQKGVEASCMTDAECKNGLVCSTTLGECVTPARCGDML